MVRPFFALALTHESWKLFGAGDLTQAGSQCGLASTVAGTVPDFVDYDSTGFAIVSCHPGRKTPQTSVVNEFVSVAELNGCATGKLAEKRGGKDAPGFVIVVSASAAWLYA